MSDFSRIEFTTRVFGSETDGQPFLDLGLDPHQPVSTYNILGIEKYFSIQFIFPVVVV